MDIFWQIKCDWNVIFQWLSSSTNVPLLYLIWRCTAAIFAGSALLISFGSNVLNYLEKDEEENISKYLIYLTNNGRLVAALALGLEVSCASVLSQFGWRLSPCLASKSLVSWDWSSHIRLSLFPAGSWWREKNLTKKWTLSNARTGKLVARGNCLFSAPFSGSCPTSPPPCQWWSPSSSGLLSTTPSGTSLTSTISLDTSFWPLGQFLLRTF